MRIVLLNHHCCCWWSCIDYWPYILEPSQPQDCCCCQKYHQKEGAENKKIGFPLLFFFSSLLPQLLTSNMEVKQLARKSGKVIYRPPFSSKIGRSPEGNNGVYGQQTTSKVLPLDCSWYIFTLFPIFKLPYQINSNKIMLLPNMFQFFLQRLSFSFPLKKGDT